MSASLLRSLALTGLALASLPVQAGAVGIVGTAGLHQDRAYYYRSDGLQGIDSQQRPNFGFGAELLLGDKDNRIQGLVRGTFLSDAPVNEPDLSNEDSSFDYTYPPAHEEPNHNVGTMMVGVQWGLLGDPTGLQLTLNSLGGSAFVTVDNLEFVMVELGAGGTYTINDRLQPFVNVAATGRFRKRFSISENVYVGVRYLFD